MAARCPPSTCINGRFSGTTQLRLQQASIVSQTGSSATVYTDLIEVTSSGTSHYVGNWYLVKGSGGWLLDSNDLHAAPVAQLLQPQPGAGNGKGQGKAKGHGKGKGN
jgi:hypothetical protein